MGGGGGVQVSSKGGLTQAGKAPEGEVQVDVAGGVGGAGTGVGGALAVVGGVGVEILSEIA